MAASRSPHPRPDRFVTALEDALGLACTATGPPITAFGIAYSGGADSTVLLHVAAEVARKHHIRAVALHVHHGLSPNADTWSKHCERQCAALGLDFASRRINVTRRPSHSLEADARDQRLSALRELCKRQDIAILTLAHNADDQAETVLLNLTRGA